MDYPVMLYLGGLNSHAIAHDDDEYDKLTEQGYVTHAEAVKIEPKIGDNQRAGSKLPNDKDDQLAEAYEHIELLEKAIDVKDNEILDLKGQVERSDEWNNEVAAQNELHKSTIRELNEKVADLKSKSTDTQEVADLKAKLAIYEESKDVNGDGVVSYDEMTKDELKSLLEQRDVEFVERDSKDALIQKAKDSE